MFINFTHLRLRTKLLGAFLIVGSIVSLVAMVAWFGNLQLTNHVNKLSNDTLPSLIGLWKINEGHTQIQLADLTILNTRTPAEVREAQFFRIEKAQKQIEDGFKEYNNVSNTEVKTSLNREFIRDWNTWKQAHEEFVEMYQKFDEMAIYRPGLRQAELLKLGLEKSPQMAAALAASELLDRINTQTIEKKDPAFFAAKQTLLQLLEKNQKKGYSAKQAADREVGKTTLWVLLGTIIGPFSAVTFGIFFSRAISQEIDGVVKAIAASSSQIAATVEQQESISFQQARASDKCVTTIEELGTSSQQAAGQAESVALAARSAYQLSEEGTRSVELTLEKMATLKTKVEAIARQILHLNQQTNQIGSISTVVGNLAIQTNMLALNAAVEAVRSGQDGRGFSVVASEIRKVAEQSKKAAETINTIVADIHTASRATVMVTEEGIKMVDEASKIAQQTAAVFTGVTDAIKNIVVNNQEIALSAQQQAVAIQQLVEALNSLNQGAAQTASWLQDTRIATQKLNQAALNLKLAV